MLRGASNQIRLLLIMMMLPRGRGAKEGSRCMVNAMLFVDFYAARSNSFRTCCVRCGCQFNIDSGKLGRFDEIEDKQPTKNAIA